MQLMLHTLAMTHGSTVKQEETDVGSALLWSHYAAGQPAQQQSAMTLLVSYHAAGCDINA